MTRFCIDAGTLVRLARVGQPVHAAHQLVAPGSLRTRALELLLNEVRAGHLGEDEALDLHERMTATKVRLLGDRVSRRTAWRLARRLDLADLDAAEHLAVAQLQADALVTADPALRALAAGVVPLAAFEDLFSERDVAG